MSKLFLAFLLVLVCAAASMTAPDYSDYTFEKFEIEFGKFYDSMEHREIHAKEFAKNLELIQNHNAKADKTYIMKVNKFADMMPHQLKAFRGRSKRMGHQHTGIAHEMRSEASLPTTVDWRTLGAVTPVKDQGGCGSCWAFSTVESIESHLFLATNKTIILSPQDTLQCTPNPNHCGGTGGCEGAIAELGFEWAKGGIAAEATVPYKGRDAACDPKVKKAAKTNGYVKLAENDANALMNAVALVGPVSISVDASAWSFYGGGIFDGCNKKSPDVDHAVQLVGYGDGYWLVRNSWGSYWGESGYIRLYRGPNESCGTDTTPQHGSACENETAPIKVCGTCGIWYDNAYPLQVQLV